MKLIKLNTDHYIIVDDSEIKEGDWCCNIQRPYIKQCQDFDVIYYNKRNDVFKKITHSTQPLESVPLYKMPNGELIDEIWYNNIKQLSLQEVKELIGEVGVENKAMEIHPVELDEGWDKNKQYRDEWINGYNQAIEDNKEKKYTEEDIVKAIEMAREGIRVTRISEWETEKEFDYNDYQIIQSLQPKTEWEVEFVDGKLKLK